MPRVLLAELHGTIGAQHIRALAELVEELRVQHEGKVNLFQDLTQVTAYSMDAQLRFSEWARSHVEHLHKLHFALPPSSALLPTLRAVVMAVPIRAYLYADRKGLDSAINRFARFSLPTEP